ncbi:glycosyltransferase family 4 protein [Clostridium sp. CTA-5]
MNKEKVLIVHNYYQVPGGEDTVVANEKKMLEDNGHEVFIYTRHNDEIKESGIWGKIKLLFETIYSFKTIKEVKEIIRENNIDIVHVHNTLPLISPSVYKAAKDCGVKVVQTVHNFRLLCPGATFTCNGEICEKCMSKGLKCAIQNKCYRDSAIQTLIVVLMLKINRIIGSYDKVDAYIALTKFSKEKISKFIHKNKIFVKPNFTENINMDILPAENREYFVFLGRIDQLKGIKVLLNTWKNIKNEELLIIGKGPEELYVKKFIEENNINNIKILGLVENKEVKKVISKAKALIAPSIWYETFGMVNIEAFSVGTPVIASNIGAFSDVLNDKNGIKFTVNSIDELVNCINIFSDYKILDKYINGAYVDYKKKYTVEKNYKILLEIYKL